MDAALETLFGHHGADLDALQMGMRAIALFFISLLLIRIAGMRSVGLKSAFDVSITILLGAVLARALTGQSPFWPTVCACTVLVLVKRFLAQVSRTRPALEAWIKGQRHLLAENGVIDEAALARAGLSHDELRAGLRRAANTDELSSVRQVISEANGDISVVR